MPRVTKQKQFPHIFCLEKTPTLGEAGPPCGRLILWQEDVGDALPPMTEACDYSAVVIGEGR